MAVSLPFLRNLIMLCANFDIILQISIQISELNDRPIQNNLLTVQKEIHIDRRQKLLQLVPQHLHFAKKCCGVPCRSLLGSIQLKSFNF